MTVDLGDVRAVVMAKLPRPGHVKTRLVTPGGLDAAVAAEVAAAMLACTVGRLAAAGEVVLAVSPDGTGPELAAMVGWPALPAVDQGPGDLGARLERVWERIGPDRPVAFFGGDSPDVPDDALDGIPHGLDDHDVLVGPTPDGGYWTIAARRGRRALFRRIDWGSDRVYDQTRRRARAAGLRLGRLPTWPDVDEPADLAALRGRLAALPPAVGRDDPRRRLAARLDMPPPAAAGRKSSAP
ncbi:MAG: TIGR04282 family arsenosugar biosynthesis glycosyltransferase [Planctomycetota bacterium]|jgi:rSAM/selenodomain-associated transferase 1